MKPALWIMSLLMIGGYSYSQKTLGTAQLPVGTERRLALLIGNRDYTDLRPLKNTHRDVDSMANVLRFLGFEVIPKKDLDYQQTIVELNRFGDKIKNVDIALFYYSGHGIGYNNRTFLLPKKTNISCIEQVEEEGIALNRILKAMELAPNLRNSFVFMDNCRNLSDKIRPCIAGAKDGYIPVGLVLPKTNPKGRMAVFATQEGTTADDDIYDAYNSLFTSELIKYLRIPNLGIRDIMDRVAQGMETRSNGKQVPDKQENLRGNFIFIQTQQPSVNVTYLAQQGVALYERSRFAEAFPLLLRAAEFGDADAQAFLSRIYRNGDGVEKNYDESFKWASKSAAQHNPNGQAALSILYSEGWGVKSNPLEALALARQSAQKNNSYGQVALGFMYADGTGVVKDETEAVRWFRKAAEQGYANGQSNLGFMYENGKGVIKNEAEAVKWYQKAAEQGDENAKKALIRLKKS